MKAPIVVLAGEWRTVVSWCQENSLDPKKVTTVIKGGDEEKVRGMLPGTLVYLRGWSRLPHHTLKEVMYRANRSGAKVIEP